MDLIDRKKINKGMLEFEKRDYFDYGEKCTEVNGSRTGVVKVWAELTKFCIKRSFCKTCHAWKKAAFFKPILFLRLEVAYLGE